MVKSCFAEFRFYGGYVKENELVLPLCLVVVECEKTAEYDGNKCTKDSAYTLKDK